MCIDVRLLIVLFSKEGKEARCSQEKYQADNSERVAGTGFAGGFTGITGYADDCEHTAQYRAACAHAESDILLDTFFEKVESKEADRSDKDDHTDDSPNCTGGRKRYAGRAHGKRVLCFVIVQNDCEESKNETKNCAASAYEHCDFFVEHSVSPFVFFDSIVYLNHSLIITTIGIIVKHLLTKNTFLSKYIPTAKKRSAFLRTV